MSSRVSLLHPRVLFLRSGNCRMRAIDGKRSTLSHYHRASCSLVFLSRGVPNVDNLRALTRVGSVSPAMPIVVVAGDRRRSVVSVTVNDGVTSCLVGPIGPGRVLLSLGGGLRHHSVISRMTRATCRRGFNGVNVRVGSSLATSS